MADRAAPENVRSADDARVSPNTAHVPEGRALRRGLLLLDAVQRSGDSGVRIVDLCRALRLERAPVYRLLATLIDCGHVRRDGRYRYVATWPSASGAGGTAATAGWPAGAVEMASRMARRLAPVLARVSGGCGDAAFAVVREGHSAWCVARHIGTYPVQMLTVQVGSRQPLGVGAAGLALLAALPAAEADAAIASHGQVLARYGGMTAERLQLLVLASRERGWTVVGNHAVPGVLGVGHALLAADGRPLAGISVAAAMDRMTRQRQRLIAGLMHDALRDLPASGAAAP